MAPVPRQDQAKTPPSQLGAAASKGSCSANTTIRNGLTKQPGDDLVAPAQDTDLFINGCLLRRSYHPRKWIEKARFPVLEVDQSVFGKSARSREREGWQLRA